MKRRALPCVPMFLCLVLVLTCSSQAQLAAAGIADSASAQPASSRTFSFSGSIPGQLDGALSVTFSIYPDQQSATALWTETQVVQVTGEKYNVMLGSSSPTGLPQDIFSADQAHWLGVQVNGAEKRYLLMSVPYAMKAVEAERLGGLLPSDFVTVQQLQSALQSAATGTGASSQPTTSSTGPITQAAAAGTPPQPATDFTDNNTSEVLLVTQQGTGFAIHAITSSQAEAILAQNDSIGGTALHALATNATGASIGVLAETASPNGIAGVFNNQTGGKILSLRNNGVEVAGVDASGNVSASGQVQASNFVGSGAGLFNIPLSAVNATSINIANSVVARDGTGSFNANQIFANTFSGSGAGLFNIPLSAVNATPINIANSVVARDGTGSFNANQIFANTFSGSGAGLFNIPLSAVNATPVNIANSVVARDGTGSFNANQIFANSFSGSGAGLFNIPLSAVNATPVNIANSVVARDVSGSFNANQIFANMFSGSGAGLFNIPLSAVNATPTPIANSVVARDGAGGFSAASINVNNLIANAFNGTAIQGSAAGNAVGIQAATQNGIGLWAGASANDSTGTALLLSHASQGKLVSGGVGSDANVFETFSVGAAGDVSFNGAMMTPYETTGTWFASSLVKLTSIPGNFGAGTVAMTSPGDTSGAIGIISGLPASGSRIQVVQSGQFTCNFDAPATSGHYVGISKTTAGDCADIGASYPTDGQQVVGRVLSSFAPGSGRILLFQSELHSNAASAFSINTGAGLTGGPITSSGTISVADGGITAAKLAPNAVTSANIVDNSIPPAKITGTAATLGNNTFTGTQTMSGLNVNGGVNLQGFSNSFISSSNSSGTAMQVQGGSVTNAAFVANGSFNAINASSNFGYGVFATSPVGTGLHGDGATTGVEAQTGSGVALSATVNNFGGAAGTAGVFTHFGTGKILSGRSGSPASEVFSVDAAGNLLANGNFSSFGALTTQYPNSTIGTLLNSLVKLTPNGFAVSTSAGDSGGAIGIAVAGAGTTGNVQIAYAGRAMCQFDNNPSAGDYVGISHSQTGMCVDLGQSIPISSGQIIGRIISPPPGVVTGLRIGQVLLFNSESRGGTVSVINTGAGLIGGPITSSGFISIASNGVTNAMLQNSSVNVIPGAGLAGGGPVSLGGTITLNNTGALSFNGRSGNVLAAPGDYSFAQIAGTAGASQLPSTVVYNNQSNTFTTDQTVQGNLAASGNINAGGSVTATALTGTSANLTGAATSTNSVLAVNDTGASGSAISVNSANNPAALFISSGPTVFMAGKVTGATTVLSSNGDLTLNGNAHASAFSGDGSALTNVSAAKIGTLAQADIATNAALSAETTARQTDIANVQASIGAESLARQQVEASLLSSLSAETTARQSDVSTLQTNINNVSAADAKLAASNTFTAGTQDFSGAGATLPVRTVLTANTPTACVASKELLIKTDAPAGQQLFICDASGTTWNLVGDGAANGVSSFNGRNGSVSPASGDYSFAQISGSASASQLPATVAYNNQSNTFTGNQTVNGSVTATSFSGSGTGLTGVNAASLNGIPSNAFAQLHTINSFTSEQAFAASTAVNPSLNIPAGVAPATPLAGDVWNTGAILQYRDNASTTRSLVSTTQSGGLQLLKLTTSITPANVTSQSCTEQSFAVSGITTSDVLLSVLQPATSSPGTNIAIGGFRVSAANTVAIQFCNVSRNNSTPTSGVYTFALMR